MSVIFPKPLPPLIKENITDQSGFTALEKATLRNIWRVVKRHQRKHARNLFLEFYTENEYMIDRFRRRDRKISMHSLHSHPEAILRIYGRLIEEGLDNFAMFHVILTEVAAYHILMMKTEAQEVVMKQAQACQEYFENVIKSINSPSNTAALKKLTDVIISYLTS